MGERRVALNLADLEEALSFVSDNRLGENEVYIARSTGQLFYYSAAIDMDELPEDVYDQQRYLMVPTPQDLALGARLAYRFVEQYLPDEIERVYHYFHHRGAYSRFKGLLSDRRLLETWYLFEQQARQEALREWCAFHQLPLEG